MVLFSLQQRAVNCGSVEKNALHSRLCALAQPLGEVSGALRIAGRRIRLEGLDSGLVEELQQRWGSFFQAPGGDDARYVVRVVVDRQAGWLEQASGTERYRLEALCDASHRVYASYHFALCPLSATGHWKLAVTRQDREPVQRVVENAVRFLTAHLALECGGFAMHGAGILRDGRVHIFAGPSRSGKTTAVGLTDGAVSLGDDFAMVLPLDEGWGAPALPFDNSEQTGDQPAVGLNPVAGIWRLHHAAEGRIEYPPRKMAIASLLGCTAFPWALPEQAPVLLERARAFVSTGRFGHLHFSKTTDLWNELLCGATD